MQNLHGRVDDTAGLNWKYRLISDLSYYSIFFAIYVGCIKHASGKIAALITSFLN